VWTATDEFFERLGQAAHDPRLRSVRGTARFEISDGESTQHWHVAVLHGDRVPVAVLARLEAAALGAGAGEFVAFGSGRDDAELLVGAV